MSELPNPTNPFAPPAEVEPVAEETNVVQAVRGSSTIKPRYLAATIDMLGSFVAAVVVFKLLPESLPVVRAFAPIVVWFGYFTLSEWLFAATPGKALTGLMVTNLDGDPISWRQACIRTLTRIGEVNPFLLGGLPAAIAILASQRRQRIGDMWAHTLVVRRRRFRKPPSDVAV